VSSLKRILLGLIILSNLLFGIDKLENVSVQLHWKYQFEFAGLIAAKEKGFYKDSGLNVELKEYKFGMNLEDEVLKGKSNYGVYNSTILLSYLKNRPIKLLASFFKRSAMVIITKPEIKNLQDLIGKNFMAINDTNLRHMFEAHSIDIKRINIVKPTYNIQDFIDGKVDAMTAFISNQPYKLDNLGVKYNIIDPSDFGMYILQHELFSSAKEVEEHPIRVEKFRKATIKGWKYALEHQNEIVDIIYDKYSKNISKKSLQNEAKEINKLILPFTYKVGSIDKNFLIKQLELFKKDFNIKSDINLEHFIFNDSKKILAINLTQKEKNYIKSHQVLKVHNETNWAPFNFNEDGKAKGYSVDYMNLLAKKLNIKIQYISGYTWAQFMQMLPSSSLDLIINIAENEDRKKFISFSDPYYTAQNVIYTHRDSIGLISLKDLENKSVAITKGFYVQALLEKYYPNIKLKLVKNQLEALKLVSLKKVDAVIGEKAVMDYLLLTNAISDVAPVGFIEDKKFVTYLRIGASKKDQILVNILTKIQKQVSTEEIRELRKKWFGIENIDLNRLTTKEKSYIKNKKILKVCINPNWRPIEFYKMGVPQGISIDTLAIINKNIKINLQFVKTSSWSQSLEFLKEKKCDILPSAVKTTKRLEYANFTEPYLHYDLAIVTKRDKPLVTNLDNIVDETMARKKCSGLISKLKEKYPDINILETKNYAESFMSVSAGKSYFTIATLPVVAYNKNKFELDNLQIAGYAKMKYNLSIAVRKDDLILLNIMNKELGKIDNNTHNAIYEKWTTKQVEFKTDYKLIFKILTGMILFILIMIYFQIKVKKHNSELEQVHQELEELNKTLEFRIKEEVEKNRKKDQQLLEQSRMAQMGEMISMIAHQWRQPLAAISSTSAAIGLKAKLNKLDKDTAIELSNKIADYSQHLSSTIDDFRDFFKTKKEKKETNFNEIVKSVLSIVEDSIRSQNIELIVELNCKSTFYTYQNEIKQVILNLIKNAEDILIEKKIKKPSIRLSAKNACLIISDNGGGIPEDVIGKIFNPYFSTKTKKDGTGLGLYMSKIIVEEHCKGELNVSNSEFGAVFEIVLKRDKE